MSKRIPKTDWACLKNQYSTESVTINLYANGVPTGIETEMQDAIDAGFSPINAWISKGIYGKPVSVVYDEIDTRLKSFKLTFNEVWIDATIKQGAPWSKSPAENVNLLQSLVAEAQKRGHAVGINTGRDAWSNITANSDAFASLPLWAEDLYFEPFGGWANRTLQSLGDYMPSQPYCKMDTKLTTTSDVPKLTCCSTENCSKTCEGPTCYRTRQTYPSPAPRWGCAEGWRLEAPTETCAAAGYYSAECCNTDRCNFGMPRIKKFVTTGL